MKVRSEISWFEQALRSRGSPERAAGEKRYLKSDLHFAGVPVPEIRRLVSAWLKHHPELNRQDLTALVRALWRRRLHELRAVALVLLQRRETLLEPDDLPLLESMLRRSFTWAYVDSIAGHTVGALVERHPALHAELDRWATDEDFWIRRSAILALLGPLRRGQGDWSRFVRYADPMLEEKEFFIRKVIGWVLREVSKKDPGRVYAYLKSRTDRVSGLTLREGSKYLPDGQREELLAAYRSR
jgi:3-methyladenine DNA glycosylase AlkD